MSKSDEARQKARQTIAQGAVGAFDEMMKTGADGYGFAALEAGGETTALVLVCLTPARIGPLMEWIASQGDFSPQPAPERLN